MSGELLADFSPDATSRESKQNVLPGCICPLCFSEDDGHGQADADASRGGPNGARTLTQARASYRSFGASNSQHLGSVRKALPDEMP